MSRRGVGPRGKAKGIGRAPAPLTPPDCDLRDLPSIMLRRSLFASDLAALSTGDEFKAAMLLYDAAYDQLPAGSLPADDRVLAFLSRSASRWPTVKSMALRGWVLCSDGRYYHPVTAEKALIAWIGRLKQRLRSKAGGEAKNKTAERFDQAPMRAQIDIAMAHLARVAPESKELASWTRDRPGQAAEDAQIVPLRERSA